MSVSPTDREIENARAIGGMRNPHLSLQRLPGVQARGAIIGRLLNKARELWPELRGPATSILKSERPQELRQDVIDQVRQVVVKTLWGSETVRPRTAKASTPLRSEVIAGWVEDPDSETLARWLDHGAPMGFDEEIVHTGIFPPVAKHHSNVEAEQLTAKSMEGWKNYTSAEEENKELQTLINDYVERGFCHIAASLEEATEELGRKPILNRLGVLVKERIDAGKVTKKTRIIWDLRRSGANLCCHQGERVLLPRLLDLAAGALANYRKGVQCWLAALDFKDAFMNVPVSSDRYALVSAKPKCDDQQDMELVIFDTLVFGAARSPTIWGRFAAWFGRSVTAVEPKVNCQTYIDDPAMVLAGEFDEAVQQLTNVLMWAAITGFPVKLSKATGGKEISWVGAKLKVNDQSRAVVVTIPEEKIAKLRDTAERFLSRPVVGAREMRSFAGSLSFIAGLVPHLRPFLSSLWSVLPSCRVTADDGASTRSTSGKLVHVRRVRPGLLWIRALLTGEAAPLRRQLEAFFPELEVTITTDACPFGIGGTLRVSGELKEVFHSDLPKEVLAKFNAAKGDSKYTTLWEALALLVACRLWLPQFKGRAKVHCRSDSLSLLLSLVKGRAKSSDLAVIAREFSIDMARDLYRLHILNHIPGVTNIEADALSRILAPVPPKLPPEGFAIPRRNPSIPDSVQGEVQVEGGHPRPYGRGTAAGAIAFIADPERCKSSLVQDMSASTTKGPTASRKNLWETLAKKAGYDDPFHLEPDLVLKVMGALKLANFRSAQLYLDTAKAEHISRGYPWSDRLQQCYRASVRSCNRHLGNPKQAAPLPLADGALLPVGEEPAARGGPKWPVRASVIASWWLLREIEASNTLTTHMEVDEKLLKVSWRLPSSKTD
eukprot:s1434_g17.t1